MKLVLCLLLTSLTSIQAIATEKKGLKTRQAQSISLTEEEKKIVQEANEIFKRSKKMKAPSKNMQDKMQSAFSDK